MTEFDMYIENIGRWKKTSWSLIMVALMIFSLFVGMNIPASEEVETNWADSIDRTSVQTMDQSNQPYQEGDNRGDIATPFTHPALLDPAYSDSGVMYGKINDLTLLDLRSDGWTLHLEERLGDDHDNDGIDDLNDLDDDNDGIYDLIERFDGCFGTGPLDHDNDGVTDELDWDDDNDGILEGPLDMTQGADPLNVSTDRYVMPGTNHPWTGDPIPVGYLADQNPWDHDNDGVPDEDYDGSGPGSYDEDDDNDGQIDQFTWPCDYDGDGQQDYFDDDDDNDGIPDLTDAHPYNASNTTTYWDGVTPQYTTWTLNQYAQYSGGVDFVEIEALYHPNAPTFTTIVDGDLDGDGIPNFLDPDNDNDGSPDNADTDDDNDGLLDMWDPDDDNDGILDACTNVDLDGDGISDLHGTTSPPYQVAGSDGDGDGIVDCERDYDRDQDDDRWRAIDQNYNGIWDWFDADLGGNASPDNPIFTDTDVTNDPWDIDDDGTVNEADAYPTTPTAIVNSWNCLTVNPDPRCDTERASYVGFNDWDGDGIDNWKDVDDDGDGILDWLDIDPDCDFDNDNDIHQANGSLYRDDGPNDVDSDIDGDGLENTFDWDDDNDGINDLYDPDDGNCGFVDNDASDQFYPGYYPVGDGNALDGSNDDQQYASNSRDYWNMTYLMNPFTEDQNFILNYNGYDVGAPMESGLIPEFYWYFLARWSPWSGGNEIDIDSDGDSLQNGLDTDQDADGLPDWWDQDEGNDGMLDINDFKMGGTLTNSNECGWTSELGYACGYDYAKEYRIPLETASNGVTLPFSTRPDPTYTDGTYDGANSANNWRCTDASCYQIPFGGTTVAAFNYSQVAHNRDLFITWIGLSNGYWNWNADINGNFFPDESLADLYDDDTDPDDDCGNMVVTGGGFTYAPTCQVNDTADLDDDLDGVYDLWDVDDDNDGIWDYLEIDSDRDWDDDANTLPPGNFFTGFNCQDNDDDGTDSDPDEDGWYQAVWDQGVMGQGLLFPQFYDVDNDNDGVPDGEDPDDDNDGVLDVDQELECFWGEEQSTWDHDNDGILNWADDDWDGDGIPSSLDIAGGALLSPWDHDNDNIRDDIDLDDDSDGMHDEDEILLWPSRFGRNSTNPWDHDDFGNGEALSDPSNFHTGPDVRDLDDDNDTREDADFDILEEGFTTDPCYNGNQSSDWDHDNDCTPDEDDKIPTRVDMATPDTLWLDAQMPAIFSGTVYALNYTTGNFTPTGNLPVQVHVAWKVNGTAAVETIDVLSNEYGAFSVGQFLFPENIHVGDNTTYEIWAEVTEMFIHDGYVSPKEPVGVSANLTLDYWAWNYFRSDEQPLWLDFKTHYEADWERGIFNQRIPGAPITFSISGGPFGNRTTPTNYTGFGQGYRADSSGWTSLTYVQQSGAMGDWKQVRYNSTLDTGISILGGYEEIVWNAISNSHDVVGQYAYTNTSLPVGDYEITGYLNPTLASEWPWPYVYGDETDTFTIRSMHRMYVEAEIIVSAHNPVYYYDNTQFTGSGYGAWRALFSEPGLVEAGYDTDMSGDISAQEFSAASIGKPYAQLWDGTPSALIDESAKLRPFLRANSTHWFVSMQNGGDFDVPPCGQIDPSDPQSPLRCEIVPEMNTGETFRVIGNVTNRTGTPWLQDPMALQVDLDHNGIFQGSTETGWARVPSMYGGEARFDYNWSWYSQYQASTYGVRVDFTNSEYYFTGNLTNVLSPTGAYGNISVIGTTDFQLTTLPRLYRNQNATIEARLVDNALQPVRSAPVNWIWSANGEQNYTETDQNGVFKIDLNISEFHQLGNFSLQFSFPGNSRLEGSLVNQEMWVVSRTFVDLLSTTPNIRSSGEYWDFTAEVTDDGRTPAIRDSGQALDGNGSDGGTVQVIFEGTDFNNIQHRQVMFELSPNAGAIYGQLMLDAQLLKEDPASYLPDGFGPVNVILRFEENLPHEGCVELQEYHLSLQGAWDPCLSIQGNDHYRRIMQHNVDGFSLIGRTTLSVDNQVVYTSGINPNTGLVEPKPMVVTGQLIDELGDNLSYRSIRVSYEMQGGIQGVISCPPGSTDADGYYEIVCPLDNVMAGQARVTVNFNSYENNDRYRYKNASATRLFSVFSNSTLMINEVGPFRTDVDRYPDNPPNHPVLYLKESYHIHGILTQTNGNPLGGKCVNIYFDPDIESTPVATAWTNDETGEIEWFSGEDGVEVEVQDVNNPEGYRLLRVAYEPDPPGGETPGGCRAEPNAPVEASFADQIILVRSRVDMVVKDPWTSQNGYLEYDGDKRCAELDYSGKYPCVVTGSVAILRDRFDSAVVGVPVNFTFEYLASNGDWVLYNKQYILTNERGVANFSWQYPGQNIPGEEECDLEDELVPCAADGWWRVTASFDGTQNFQGLDGYNHTRVVSLGAGPDDSNNPWDWKILLPIIMAFLFASIIGAVMYKRYSERRRVEILRGILTDSLMALQARNEYIQVIFNCYKDLVRFFRQNGFMKKVYETTREFEWAVRKAFYMVPADQLDDFLAIFEEARYSDHDIGIGQRDKAMSTLTAITQSISMALGDSLISRTTEHEAALHGNLTKAGEFVDSEGNVQQAGLDESQDAGFSL